MAVRNNFHRYLKSMSAELSAILDRFVKFSEENRYLLTHDVIFILAGFFFILMINYFCFYYLVFHFERALRRAGSIQRPCAQSVGRYLRIRCWCHISWFRNVSRCSLEILPSVSIRWHRLVTQFNNKNLIVFCLYFSLSFFSAEKFEAKIPISHLRMLHERFPSGVKFKYVFPFHILRDVY